MARIKNLQIDTFLAHYDFHSFSNNEKSPGEAGGDEEAKMTNC